MYLRLVHHYPQDGKNAELRTLIEEFVTAENASGTSTPQSVLVTMLEPRNSVIHGIQHEDFAAWEKHISNRSPGFEAYAAKMQALIAGSNLQEIFEVLAWERSNKPQSYLWQTIHTAKEGDGQRLRKLLEERVKTSIERGSSGSTLVANAFDPTFSIAVAFADLADLESYRKGTQADPEAAAWGAALRTVSAAPARQVLMRVVVPFPES